MSMTEAASESRRIFNAAVAKAPARAAEARATLNQLSDRARDMAARAQTRARDQLHRRRSLAADQLESLADVLRPEDEAAKSRRKAIAIAGGSSLALVAVLGTGVALGLMLSRQLKKRAEQRAAEATALEEEAPPTPQAMGQDPARAGLNL